MSLSPNGIPVQKRRGYSPEILQRSLKRCHNFILRAGSNLLSTLRGFNSDKESVLFFLTSTVMYHNYSGAFIYLYFRTRMKPSLKFNPYKV